MKIKYQEETFNKIIDKMKKGEEDVSISELTFMLMSYNKKIYNLLLTVLVIVPLICILLFLWLN